MKLGETASAALVLGAFLVALSGCQKQEGPAEKAGKEIDRAVEKVGLQIEKTGDAAHEAATDDRKDKT